MAPRGYPGRTREVNRPGCGVRAPGRLRGRKAAELGASGSPGWGTSKTPGTWAAEAAKGLWGEGDDIRQKCHP